jgi:hypothetical protein
MLVIANIGGFKPRELKYDTLSWIFRSAYGGHPATAIKPIAVARKRVPIIDVSLWHFDHAIGPVTV